MPMRGDDPRQGGALGAIRNWPSLVKREKRDFVSRRKLDCVCREKRILLVAFSRRMVTFRRKRVAFSRQTAEQSSSMFYFTARVKGRGDSSSRSTTPWSRPSRSSLDKRAGAERFRPFLFETLASTTLAFIVPSIRQREQSWDVLSYSEL